MNEAGEVAGKIKKIFRDQNGQITEEDKQSLKNELGDVLWYLTQICTELGLTLEEVAETNITKISPDKKEANLGEMAIIDRTNRL